MLHLPAMPLPFPIAHLVRRAHNAKGPKERHDTAFFAWEASVRLAVAANPPADLSFLGDPATGAWVKSMRTTSDPTDSLALRKVTLLFSTAQIEGTGNAPKTVNAKKLVEHIAAYRNEVHGHGSTRTGDFYDPAADVMLEALEEAWPLGVFWPKGTELVYVESVELRGAKERRARIVNLTGTAPLLGGPREGSRVADDIAPRRLYVHHARKEPTTSDEAPNSLRSGERTGKLTPLHPWLLYQESELRERVLFFNGRRKTARYLDYVGGEILKGPKLAEEFPALEEDLESMFGARPEAAPGPTAPESVRDPNRVGDYELLGKLGEGGMGVVYLARQESLGRTVALKVLHPGAADDPVTVARFRREIAALARLDHKNIVSILDSGEDRGKLFYAMELVEGADLAQIASALGGKEDFYAAVTTASEIARAKRSDATLPSEGTAAAERPSPRLSLVDTRGKELKVPERIRTIAALFRDAARAVHYLHTQGMIHRDLKPANLMVTTADHRVVLMDLGLVVMANASRSITKDKSSILGTLRYMPPEQLQRNAGQVDRRVDVYSLGATFYELLTERPFFDGDTETRLVAQVLNEEPIPPSKGKVKLPADLCTILEKATKKDPNLRYDSADDLANDLDAFLEARPIAARAPTLAYVARMAALRNKPLTALLALSALFVFVGIPTYAVREKRLRIRSEDLAREAAEQRNEARLAVAHILEEQGRQELTSGRPLRALRSFIASKEGGNDGPTLRFMIARAARAAESLELDVSAHDEAIATASFSPDGDLFVTGSTDGTARVWDSKTGASKIKVDLGARVRSTYFDVDGKRLLAATKREIALFDVAGGQKLLGLDVPREVLPPTLTETNHLIVPMWNGTAQVVDVATKKVIATLVPPKRPKDNADDERVPLLALLAPDGAHVLTTSPSTGLVLWDVANETKPIPHAVAHEDCDTDATSGRAIELHANGSFDHQGARVVTVNGCSHEGRIWDVATRKVLARFHLDAFVNGATFTPDGKRLLALGDDGRVAIFRADNGRLVAYLHDRGAVLGEPRITPDGTRIVTRGDDERIRIFDARTGSLTCVLDGHRSAIADIDFAANGSRMLTAGDDGTVKMWGSACGWDKVTIDRVGDGAAISGNARYIVLWDVLGAELVDVTSKERTPLGARPEPPGTAADAVLFAAFSADGALVATAGADGSARVWRVADRGSVRTFTHTSKVRVVRFSLDGKRLFTASDDRSARVWSLTTGEPLALFAHAAAVVWGAFFAEDRRLVTRTADDVVTVWDASTGAALKTLPHKAGKFVELDVAAKAPRFTVPCEDGTVRVFDDAGAQVGVLRGSGPEDRVARLSPDGLHAVTSAGEKSSHLYDVATGSVAFVLDGDRARLRDAAFSADGAFVLASGDDGAARLFDARTGKLLDVADGHREGIDAIETSAGGRSFLTRASAGLSEEVIVWTLPEDTRDVATLKALLARKR